MRLKTGRTGVVFSAIIATAVVIACVRRPVTQPSPEPLELLVLLPDPDHDGSAVGRVIVSNRAGSVELSGAWQATRMGFNRPPKAVETMDKADVERMFGEVLAGLPPAPLHFTLYFRFESDELTPESQAMTTEILRVVRARPYPDVIVVGHTDTMGSAASNYVLGLRRAMIIRNLLAADGLDSSAVEIRSHGEGDPLIRTPDETYEPRNRRVEIDIQ